VRKEYRDTTREIYFDAYDWQEIRRDLAREQRWELEEEGYQIVDFERVKLGCASTPAARDSSVVSKNLDRDGSSKATLTTGQWLAIRKACNGCMYCEAKSGPMHLEHMIPISRGGWTGADNVVLSCKSCNYRKKTKTVDEFLTGDALDDFRGRYKRVAAVIAKFRESTND